MVCVWGGWGEVEVVRSLAENNRHVNRKPQAIRVLKGKFCGDRSIIIVLATHCY